MVDDPLKSKEYEPPVADVLHGSSQAIGRREFVRLAALVAAGVAAAPLLAACNDAAPAPAPAPTSTANPSTATSPATPEFTPAPAGQSPAPYSSPASGDASKPESPSPVSANAPSPTVQATSTPESAQAAQPPAPTFSSTPPPKRAASPTSPSAVALRPHGVALLASSDRAKAVPAVLDLLGFAPGWLKGKSVALKANFNSADPPPGSTHLDTLRALLQRLQDWGASQITLLERSGMGDTGQVLRQRGVTTLAKEFGVKVVILDDLPARDWVHLQGAHWGRGFLFPRLVQEADAVVQTCCLKTHRFGGHFTLSLKNSVGLVAKYDPTDGYNYMGELHSSPSQRLMIAEINAAYQPALILLDGVLAFVNGGPDQGKKVQAGLFLAGRDRVALDAVGVAMLRNLGTTPEVSRGAIFDQPQLAHAAALGLGAASPAAITLHPASDDASKRLAGTLQKLLAA